MTYIRYGLIGHKIETIQCDQCYDTFTKLQPGMLTMMEVQDSPSPIRSTYHFCNLEELREWLEDKEQV